MNNPVSPQRTPLRLLFPLLLAGLVMAGLVWGLDVVSPARAGGTLRYVDGVTGSDDSDCTNSTDPCATIQYAINQSTPGDEIRVAEGTYTGTLNIGITATLKGGYEATGWTRNIAAHPTVVDANGADASVVNLASGVNVTIEGFTIQDANYVSDWGGGFAINGATVTISATIIQSNHAGGSGGGIFVEGSAAAASLTIVNSAFNGNTAGGGSSGLAACCGTVDVKIENTTFTGNTGGRVLNLTADNQTFEITGVQVVSNTVGGIAVMAVGLGGRGTLSNTHIMSNTAGALVANGRIAAHSLTVRNNVGGIGNGGVLTLTNSLLENNADNDGNPLILSQNFDNSDRLIVIDSVLRGNSNTGVIDVAGGFGEIRSTAIIQNTGGGTVIIIGEGGVTPTVKLINVLLAGNQTQSGSILGQYSGTAYLMNVTMAGNSVPSGQNVLFAGSAMTLTNSIVWGNTTDTDTLGASGTLAVSYSDIEGGWAGTGNLNTDPLFVDAANGDYHLKTASPARDAGTPSGAPPTDLDGIARDLLPDMGAFEWSGYRIWLPILVR